MLFFFPGFDPDALVAHWKLCCPCVAFAPGFFLFLESTLVQLALHNPGLLAGKIDVLILKMIKTK